MSFELKRNAMVSDHLRVSSAIETRVESREEVRGLALVYRIE